ncbi:GntR family transcriptional regulator [Actinomadura darangshiensis]|uniref:GntR family transcriptional regulator n=1 Tax=Actinomadura darangshiensis TaxID=705336 RepID=A0A4R5BAC6_9ACTN|nr:GntR family transcriptional regulator [Actinomadura darangshiensis]TDD83338.1 GntR family transcriptional regulator [Actinomadura darangshiensis]
MDAVADAHVGLPELGGRDSLREQVAEALRNALIGGKLRSGVVYSAPALAEEFGVSATPVREAMIDLVRDGLFETVRNRGFRVAPLSARDLAELTELRELVEVPAVVRLAGAIPEAARERLRALADETAAAAEIGDLLHFLDADRRLHTELLGLTGNRTLVRTVLDLRYRSRMYSPARPATKERLASSAAEHRDLVEALVAGHADRAREIMMRHLDHVRNA